MRAGCEVGTGDYCLFGFKWGTGNDFLVGSGVEAEGPRRSGGVVTYSFQNTSDLSFSGAPSQPFSDLPAGLESMDTIRSAFRHWAEVADIEFQELPDEAQDADLKLFVADIEGNGRGFPNIPQCGDIAGLIVYDPTVAHRDGTFFAYALHEIGHALGLGHCRGGNVMSVSRQRNNVTDLRRGDIQGIREIYGER